MDVATVLTLVQTLLQLLDSPISREIEFLWGYMSQLQKLRRTMFNIEVFLSNIERLQSQQLPINIPPVTLEQLQDAVYQVDDLLDDVATVSHPKGLMPGNKLTKQVRLFFSRSNQLYYAFTKSLQITNLRQILDVIAHDHRDFIGAMIQPPHNNNVEVCNNINPSRDTHSFLYKKDMIIGRDEDQRILKYMLLDTAVSETVSVVSIVGIGGLGKTALAKLLYNDDDIQAEFDVMMWVCVSDDFDVKSLLGKILAEATGEPTNSGLSKQQLHIRLRQQLDRNKYLLVLDDFWNEDHVMWNELRSILMQGGRGSRIIVTTRSLRVANLAGSHLTHVLKGLSHDESWDLFQKVTQMKPGLDEIGKEIVDKCSNVPLAIKFVGSLLKGQTDGVWHSLKNTDLAHIKQDDDGNEDGILTVLKISYNHLPPHLKSCFSYCAVYPKDYKIKKEDLIYQWMAHGFIKSSNNGLSLEDIGEAYFMKLLQRCFFQDVVQDEETGEIWSCKMHDLVHDLATDISGTRVVLASNDINSWCDEKTHHAFVDDTFVGGKDVEYHLTNLKIFRTFLALRKPMFRIPRNYLRVLDLSCSGGPSWDTLASMICELLHLRYLDVSWHSGLKFLPNSITQLYNLQTLNLRYCRDLKELPRDLSKLVNLRHLDIQGCVGLEHMPRGMNSMTCLHKLTRFVVNSEQGEDIGKLEDLKDLNNLRDDIKIVVKKVGGKCDDGEQVKKGGYLINKPLLKHISIKWAGVKYHVYDADALLQRLQPHPNIKTLLLQNYPGVRLPRSMDTPLPNLVKLSLSDCSNLEEIPAWIGCLSSLQHISLCNCKGIKSLPDEICHLTCLTKLTLIECSPELKERCEKPTGADWHKIQHISYIHIKSAVDEINEIFRTELKDFESQLKYMESLLSL